MPFSFNLRNFGRFNANPVAEKPFRPTGGLAPPYDGPGGPGYAPGQPLIPPQNQQNPFVTPDELRQRTKPRLIMSAIAAFCLFVTVIFLIMVEIGNTHDKAVLRDLWFLKLEFSNIDPISNSTPGLGFGIAESIGLSDFYQVGLWNYCQGMNGTGLRNCTPPAALYWFDPVQIFDAQLVADYNAYNNFTLPQDMYDSLDEIKICSHVMFGLFMLGACLSFVLIPTVLVGVKSKWFSLGLGIVSFLNFLSVVAATIIATVVFVIIRNLFRDYVEILDVVPHIGAAMFAMMWVATAFSLVAFIIQVWLAFFTLSERDVRHGINY